MQPPLLLPCVGLTLQLVAPFKPLYPSPGIYYSPLTGEEWVALAAQLDLQCFLGGAGGKGIATGTGHLGIGKILRVNLVLHIIYSAKTLTFLLSLLAGSNLTTPSMRA